MSRPRLLICGFGPFPEAPDNPSALAVRRMQAEGWSPATAHAAYAILPTEWVKAPQTALQAAREADAAAILIVGVAVRANGFRVETLARNRASTTHPDAAGARWPQATIDMDGPDERQVLAPVEAMRGAIAAQGLPAALSKDAGDYLCNFTLYRVIAEAEGRPAAFLHVPPISDAWTLDDIEIAVCAAAEAFAANLT